MTETELLAKTESIEGLTFKQLARTLNLVIPPDLSSRKGWAGQSIEKALGATSGSRPVPDFETLGIELKTIPIDCTGYPVESTFVTSISLLTIGNEVWETSQCALKLKQVLWVPIEADDSLPFEHRRIGRARLWSPSSDENFILSQDWQELTNLMTLGKLAEIHAGIGQYLQVRPKARNSKSLCEGIGEDGGRIKTLPRGFYLRRSFTKTIL